MERGGIDVREARRRLDASGRALVALVADVDDDEARFHPEPGAWSIVEVMGHLRLEETEDFRARFASTLRDPATPWAALDPEARVREEGFDERPLQVVVAEFEGARAVSLEFLGGLHQVDLDRTYHHPRRDVTAGDLLASWVAHDLLHVRQICRTRYAYWRDRAAPRDVGYAGAW